jgi:hypothetical protein
MDLSVIVAFGRERGYLPELVAGLRQQSVPPCELVIADPHYPARRPMIEALDRAAGFPVVYAPISRSTAHRDHLYCRNAGVAVSSGDALVFLDDDELLADDRVLECYWTALQQVPIVKGWYRYFDEITVEDGRVRSVVEAAHPNQSETGPGRYPFLNLYGGNFAIHRALFEAAKGFDQFYDGGPVFTRSDIDLAVRAGRASGLQELTCPEGVAIFHPTKTYVSRSEPWRFAYRSKPWLCPDHSREQPYRAGDVDLEELAGLLRYRCRRCPATGPVDCEAALNKLLAEPARTWPLMPFGAGSGART